MSSMLWSLSKLDSLLMDTSTRKILKPKRPFDFAKHNQRRICLKIAYLGWDYEGFVTQDTTNKTIEAALFDALTKTKLIQSRETSEYHRCGRTDKGVSAFSQVISLNLRTNHKCGPGVHSFSNISDIDSEAMNNGNSVDQANGCTVCVPGTSSADSTKSNGIEGNSEVVLDETTELNYPSILNRVLPEAIRVVAWSPVPADFSARFDCKKRVYRYFFPRGDLDVVKMQEACNFLVGTHDFRNLCKMDVMNGAKEFVRNVERAEIHQLSSDVSVSCVSQETGYDMFYLCIAANAFAWHQIRCVVAVLFLVGEGREEPRIVQDLLNIGEHPCRPQYPIAADFPLNLYDCHFDDVRWIVDSSNMTDVVKTYQNVWTNLNIKANMVRSMLGDMESVLGQPEADTSVCLQASNLVPGNKPKTYRPLLSRPTGDSLETKIEKAHSRKQRKLDGWQND